MNQTEAFLEAVTKHDAAMRAAVHTFEAMAKELEGGTVPTELEQWAYADGFTRIGLASVEVGDEAVVEIRGRVRAGIVVGRAKSATWVALITPGGLVAEITRDERPNVYVKSFVLTGEGRRVIYIARRKQA